MKGSLVSAFTALCLIRVLADAALGQTFDLAWHTIDGGGATNATSGTFELSGTIGQPDAGEPMSGGGFTLSGGFWPGVGAAEPGCQADINYDGVVDIADLATLLVHFGMDSGASFGDGDIDGDGDVDLSDLSELLLEFGADCG